MGPFAVAGAAAMVSGSTATCAVIALSAAAVQIRCAPLDFRRGVWLAAGASPSAALVWLGVAVGVVVALIVLAPAAGMPMSVTFALDLAVSGLVLGAAAVVCVQLPTVLVGRLLRSRLVRA
jgi:hypothetical protein